MKKNHAFTILELLVVIGIIAVLAALIFPAYRKVRENAQLMHLTVAQDNIKAGLAAYYNEYGIYPNGAMGTSQEIIEDEVIPSQPLTAKQNHYLIQCLGGDNVWLDGSAGGNPRKTMFCKPPVARLLNNVTDASGTFQCLVNPWGGFVNIYFDYNGDHKIKIGKYGDVSKPPTANTFAAFWSVYRNGAVTNISWRSE